MDANDLVQRVVAKHPDAVTNDGHKYSDFMPKESAVAPVEQKLSATKELSKGFGKGLLQTVRDVSGVDTNPVVKDMVSHAPVMQSALDTQKRALEPSNPLQKVGKNAEGVAELAIPIVGGVKAYGLAKDLISGGLSRTLGKKLTQNTVDAISPRLTPKIGSEAAASRGLVKNKFTGMISPANDPYYEKAAQTIHAHIPEFDKLPTFADKLNAVRTTVYRLADNLKEEVIASGKDRIFPLRELGSRLAKIDPPIKIKADATLKKEFDLARQSAMKISQQNGGTVSSLFDSRKEFDTLVGKQFPNLYEKDNAPMRDAITAIRNEMNKFIAENLPKDVKYAQSLKQQSHLFDAVENLSEKAFKEVGSTYWSRWAAEHPITSKAMKYAAEGAAITAGGGSLYGAYKGLTGN